MLRNTIIIVLGSFAALILLGTVLLSLPIATVGQPLTPLNAFFTATSAVCVTGLIVVDTATAFSTFGQLVILLLIQLGGFGIITFSVLIVLTLGRRITHYQREAFTLYRIGTEIQVDFIRIAKRILAFVFLAEACGAVILTFAFLRYYPWDVAMYHAVFQSISGFCNAGFSTFSDSLVAFGGDAFVLFPMMTLIVLGGIGFVVVLDLEEFFRSRRPLTLQSR